MDLRLRGPNSQATLRGIPTDKSIGAFLDDVSAALSVPKACVQLLGGFPPKPLDLPADLSLAVSTLGLRSGDSLIVREVEPEGAKGVVVRRVIDSDNSCLFNAVGYVREKQRGLAATLRKLAADCIAADPERYSEAFLAKSNAEYCDWILKDTSWGGAIELSIFAEHFKCEIAAYDICTTRRDLYGEGQGYSKRCMLIYDGIHYDSLALSPDKDAPEAADLTAFDAGPIADLVDTKAAVFVAEQHKLRQFTDTSNFTLRCLVCQTGLKGEADATAHAKATGHTNFAEY
eukprot:TRINITY_DN79480_c0_g1_i1.p1 TRINITY_DN79480_c0_g1~~TRINITY_DN79480_c0_g1_i1.p1  ORF type:complete len:288 (+),score=54.22 TRINITY_DN79480_c0_g1_i1:52-915(+)